MPPESVAAVGEGGTPVLEALGMEKPMGMPAPTGTPAELTLMVSCAVSLMPEPLTPISGATPTNSTLSMEPMVTSRVPVPPAKVAERVTLPEVLGALRVKAAWPVVSVVRLTVVAVTAPAVSVPPVVVRLKVLAVSGVVPAVRKTSPTVVSPTPV